MDPFRDVEDIYRGVLEALLLVSTEPLSLDRIVQVLEGPAAPDVAKILDALKASYEREGRGFQVVRVGGGYQLVTRPEYARWVRKLRESRASSALSRAALETLSIIAYRQPVIRAEIDDIRGVNSGGVLKNLLERGLVRMVGKRDIPGKPMTYATTDIFLRQFGLNSLRDMPSLDELHENPDEK